MSYSLPDGAGGWTELQTPDSIARANAGGAGNLLSYGYLEDVYDPTSLCAPQYPAEPVVDGESARWTPVPLSDEDCAAAKRAEYTDEINAQVTNPTTQEVAADFRLNDQVVREQAAATDKLREVQDPATDLDTFDPTLNVAEPDDATVGYAQFAVTIGEVEPWNGAPNDTTGGMFSLKITNVADYPLGAEARVSVLDSPKGVDGPLPLTQNVDDASLWEGPMSLGKYWDGNLGPVTAVLRWGSGSIIISSEATSNGIDDRYSENVRYGI